MLTSSDTSPDRIRLHLVEAFRQRQIGDDDFRGGAAGLDLAGYRLEPVAPPGDEHDVVPVAGQALGKSFADSGGCPGNDSDAQRTPGGIVHVVLPMYRDEN
ncbi:hypothetical protein O7A60_31735 [Mesorhizobium sp. Ld1326N3]|uniref:Uncharacterized protein n=1 Tax=Mesorhizobium salmacidum TaxID=3015171 RepID=A0ABU8L6K9_9HYPH